MSPTSEQSASRPIPQRFSVNRRGDGLTISWPWFNPGCLVMLVFVATADAAVTYFVVETLYNSDKVPLPAYLFLGLFVFMGVLGTYIVLAGLVNKTTVRISSYELNVKHGPFPWIGNVTLNGSDIQEVFCRENSKTVQSSRGDGATTSFRYCLVAVTRENREILIASSLREPEYALYLEQEIQRQLRLPMSTVPGRFTGRSTEPAIATDGTTPQAGNAEFTYEAMDNRGGIVRGKVFASSEANARKQVQQRGYFVTAIKKVHGT